MHLAADFENIRCFIQNCKRGREHPLSLFCNEHQQKIVGSIVQKIKILGSMDARAVYAFLESHSDLRGCEGDLVNLAHARTVKMLTKSWQVKLNSANGCVEYISVYAASIAAGEIKNLKLWVAENGLNPNATAAIKDDARSERHGWRMPANGAVAVSTLQRSFPNRGQLLQYLNGQSRMTYPLNKIVALYPMAASHVCALHREGKISFVQNNSIIFPAQLPLYDPDAAAYWRRHVLRGLLSTTQNPGHGAE